MITCLAAFLFINSFRSIDVALPAIQKQFGNTLSEIQWVNPMGAVTIASLSFCFERAGTLLGQRWLYNGGVMLYAAGAGLGAISTSFRQLVDFGLGYYGARVDDGSENQTTGALAAHSLDEFMRARS